MYFSKSSDDGPIEIQWPVVHGYLCSQDMCTEAYTVELKYHIWVPFLLKRNIREAAGSV